MSTLLNKFEKFYSIKLSTRGAGKFKSFTQFQTRSDSFKMLYSYLDESKDAVKVLKVLLKPFIGCD